MRDFVSKFSWDKFKENVSNRCKTDWPIILWYLLLLLSASAFWTICFDPITLAQTGHLPGTDASDKLEAAGTLLRLVDTALFKWGARVFAGICIMSAAWSLKEQRFGIAIICIIGAMIFGTATVWVKNLFAISSNDSVFSMVLSPCLYRLWTWRGRHA